MKSKKRFQIPEVYIGFLILPIIGIIALIAGLLLGPMTWLIRYFEK
jgi:hypothetical protein